MDSLELKQDKIIRWIGRGVRQLVHYPLFYISFNDSLKKPHFTFSNYLPDLYEKESVEENLHLISVSFLGKIKNCENCMMVVDENDRLSLFGRERRGDSECLMKMNYKLSKSNNAICWRDASEQEEEDYNILLGEYLEIQDKILCKLNMENSLQRYPKKNSVNDRIKQSFKNPLPHYNTYKEPAFDYKDKREDSEEVSL